MNIVCFVKPNFNNISNKGIEFFYYDTVVYIYLNDIDYENKLYTIIKNSTIKILWAASDNYNGIISSRISKKLNLNSFYELRGLWHLSKKAQYGVKYNKEFTIKYENLEKQSCELNDMIICENNILKTYCINNFKIKPEKIIVLSNGVNITEDYQMKYTNFNKTLIFGYIGSIVSYEGLENLIRAIDILKDKFNTKLLIIGGGITSDSITTQKKIQYLINMKKLNTKIEILGQVSYDMIEKYYNMIDIICLPRINSEVCNIVAPLKPYESMMYGKIVFASSVDALTDIITHNVNGIIFDRDDINDLVAKISEIIDGKYNLEMIQKNGYEYVKNKTWKINLMEVNKLCEQFL
jgi:glycosyltransferase involved in cell wall biosynthesis